LGQKTLSLGVCRERERERTPSIRRVDQSIRQRFERKKKKKKKKVTSDNIKFKKKKKLVKVVHYAAAVVVGAEDLK